MTTTLLASRRTRPSAVRRPVPGVREYPIAEPAGLSAWRLAAGERTAAADVTPAQALVVLAGVRAGADRPSVESAAGLGSDQVMDVVAGVGSRIGQANKVGPRAASCLSTSRGARAGLGPGVHEHDGALVVVLAAGWGRTRKEPRDVSRSYAAIALSDPAGDDAAVRKWSATTTDDAEVTYQHLAHLYAVAAGAFPTLDGITADVNVQKAYLRGFDALVAAVRGGHQHLAVVLHPHSSASEVLEAVRGCFWLLGAFARPVARYAAAAAQGNVDAARPLAGALAQLRTAVERTPRRFFPSSIADLSRTQFRVICSQLGYPVPLDDDGTSDGTGERALIAALANARREQLALAV